MEEKLHSEEVEKLFNKCNNRKVKENSDDLTSTH